MFDWMAWEVLEILSFWVLSQSPLQGHDVGVGGRNKGVDITEVFLERGLVLVNLEDSSIIFIPYCQ